MPISLQVDRADVGLDAGFERPDFALFRDTAELLQHLFRRLEPHGLSLGDLRVEHGTGSVADFHVLVSLFNFAMTIRVRVERVEVVFSRLRKEHVQGFKAAAVSALTAIREHRPDLTFRAFNLGLALHGRPEGVSSKEYLSRFASNAPTDFGPVTANGAVFYYGPDADRLLGSLTLDASALVPDGVYLRIQVTWDGRKVGLEALPALSDMFVRRAVEGLGLQLV